MYKTFDPQSALIKYKFMLILVQAVLLLLIHDTKVQYIYWNDPGQVSSIYSQTSSTADALKRSAAESSLDKQIWSMVAFLGIEFLMLLSGVSLMCKQLTFLQNFLHFVGCFFSLWFILDSWQYGKFMYIWVLFGLLPFLVEAAIVLEASRFSFYARKNVEGRTKFLKEQIDK